LKNNLQNIFLTWDDDVGERVFMLSKSPIKEFEESSEKLEKAIKDLKQILEKNPQASEHKTSGFDPPEN
jgi:hypothetical protein